MKLVQIFLPLRDNRGKRFDRHVYDKVRKELLGRFGGLTVYSRSPARGLWRSPRGTRADDIVILEVMVSRLDDAWWRAYRRRLAQRFRQDKLLVLAQDVRRL